jgi:type II secretory pathway component PulK
LPAVLAVTGVVTLIFLVAMTALGSLTAEAASARARVRFTTRAMTAEAMMVYMAATEPAAPAGLNLGGPRLLEDGVYNPAGSGQLLRLDGRGYKVEVDGALLINPQDQAGLINLAHLSEPRYRRLGEALGLPPDVSRRLYALFQDYVDQDDLQHPSGAEASDYGGEGPANRAMRRSDEGLALWKIRDLVSAGRWRQLRGHLAVDSTTAVENVNTATIETMQVLYGTTLDQARRAVLAREQQDFLSFSDFTAATGVADTSTDNLYTYPSGRIILTIADSRSAWVYRSRLTLTPSGLERPVWIDQTELKEAPGRAVADLSDAVQLPYAPR